MRERDDMESTTLAVAHGFAKTAWRGGWSVGGHGRQVGCLASPVGCGR